MKGLVNITFFCITCVNKIFFRKEINQENHEKLRRFFSLNFRDQASFNAFWAWQIWMPNCTSTISCLQSLKVWTQYLLPIRRRSLDKPTLWKSLKRHFLKNGNDVIKIKKMYIEFGLISIRSESFTKIGSAISEKSPAQIL